MTQLKQFLAMLDSANVKYNMWNESTTQVVIEFENGTEETDFTFHAVTGNLISVEVTSSHYSD